MKFTRFTKGKFLLRWCVLFFSHTLLAQTEQQVHFDNRKLTLKEALETIENQTQLRFSFNPQVVKPETKIELSSNDLTIERIFKLFQDHGINTSRQKNLIILQLQQNRRKFTVSGTVRDASTGALLPGAQVILVGEASGSSSNSYGFYSISKPIGENGKLRVSFLGYQSMDFDFSFSKDTTVHVDLVSRAIVLADVAVVSGGAEKATDLQVREGNFTLSAQKIKDTPSFGGEPDAMKVLQFLPGVQSGNEGTTGLSVRGGSTDQNLYLLDEAPVYNPSHALSFFSIFNADALQSISLYKNSIPVMYGGRLSSVVDVRIKEGNRVKRTYSGSVGTIASRLTAEGPFSKKNDKASYMLSGRYSYAGQVVNGIYFVGSLINDPTANISTKDNKIDFYDLSAKINYRKDDRNHFYLSAYSGGDKFQFSHITSGYALAWGNNTATFRWNHIHNSRLFSNTTALFSNYKYEYRILNSTQHFLWSASLKEFDVKQDYDFYINNENHLTFGGGIELHWLNPGQVEPRSESSMVKTYSMQQQQPAGTYVYVSNEQTIGEKIRVTYGLRYSNLILTGPNTRYFFRNGEDDPYDSVSYSSAEIEKVFHRVDPRVSVNYKNGKESLTLSYDRTTQYFHFLANSSVGLPTDIWMPSGGSIKPQQSNIFAITYQHDVCKSVVGSVGVYYKTFNNILDFKDNADLFVNRYVESQLLQGTSIAYGLELFFQKTQGNFTGSISYTLSKAENSIRGVNNNKPFPSLCDKRNNLSLTSKVVLSKRWEAGLNFVYTTGRPVTVPDGNFVFEGAVFNSYSARNNYRLPDYQRMDISFRHNSKKNERRKYKQYWSFDIYNVLARKNPFTIYSQQQDHGFAKTDLKSFSLFRIVPSISYNFKF